VTASAATTSIEPKNLRTVATGLRFPEGPVALADGSVIVVEIAAGRITRVQPDGSTETVAEPGGGPNGAAIGADGALWVTNNGGCFDWREAMGLTFPGSPPPSTYAGRGALQRVDLATGAVTTVADEVGGEALKAPNDLVVGPDGAVWFTDHGTRTERSSDRTGAYWCSPDGTVVREVVFPLDAPNGIGLSPDGDTLYVAETHTGRLWSWPVTAPGELGGDNPFGPGGGALLGDGFGHLYDSLAVDGEGWVCVATLGTYAGITCYAPDGTAVEHIAMPDPLTTNICFAPNPEGAGGTAYVTLSGTGQLVAFDWHRPPGRLAFTA
jgi:gluconolactonase